MADRPRRNATSARSQSTSAAHPSGQRCARRRSRCEESPTSPREKSCASGSESRPFATLRMTRASGWPNRSECRRCSRRAKSPRREEARAAGAERRSGIAPPGADPAQRAERRLRLQESFFGELLTVHAVAGPGDGGEALLAHRACAVQTEPVGAVLDTEEGMV